MPLLADIKKALTSMEDDKKPKQEDSQSDSAKYIPGHTNTSHGTSWHISWAPQRGDWTPNSQIPVKGDLSAHDWNAKGSDADHKQQFEIAFSYYKKAADMGDLNSIKQVADRSLNGLGVKADLILAKQYYNKAARMGDSYAKTRVDYLNTGRIGLYWDVKQNQVAKDLKPAIPQARRR